MDRADDYTMGKLAHMALAVIPSYVMFMFVLEESCN